VGRVVIAIDATQHKAERRSYIRPDAAGERLGLSERSLNAVKPGQFADRTLEHVATAVRMGLRVLAEPERQSR
jgi:hypothetical protein